MTLELNTALIAGAVLAAVVTGLALLGALALVLGKTGRRRIARWEKNTSFIFIGLFLSGLGCFIYAFEIEVNRLTVTTVELPTEKLLKGQRLRIVHLSDIHADRPTKVLASLPETVNSLKPDIIIFTGDALNTPAGLAHFRDAIAVMRAPLGRYAVPGNFEIEHDTRDGPGTGGLDIFGGGVATELKGEAVRLGGGAITLCGAPLGSPELVARCLRLNPDGFRIAVYHTPDHVELLSLMGPDLYLAGHTHGGQVRVPFYGALVTLSQFGKKYEMGLYKVNNTTLYVNRGIGMEPPPAPRIRFLAPPEIAVIDIVGAR